MKTLLIILYFFCSIGCAANKEFYRFYDDRYKLLLRLQEKDIEKLEYSIGLIKNTIECYSYTYHKNELDIHLDPIIIQYKKTKSNISTGISNIKTYTLDNHRERAKSNFVDYFDELRREILNLGDDIEEGYVTEYIKYVVKVIFAEIHVRQQTIIVNLRIDKNNFEDPKSITKDISHRGWSTTRELKITKNTKINDAMFIIKQAYDYQQ